MTFGFLSGSRNFCKLLWVSCEVLFLHGYAWIHWVAKSCTTTAQLSLRTLWSAVIKSPKFSARGTAPPLRLLHGALVILVLLQISQFRSLGKWVKTLCYPNPHVSWIWALKNASWQDWRENLLVVEFHHPPNFPWILAATPGSQNTTGCQFYRGFLFICFWVIIGLGFIRLPWSIINRSWHVHWRDVTVNSIFSFSSLNFTYCRWKDEAEEDDEEWLSCLEGVFEVDVDPETNLTNLEPR